MSKNLGEIEALLEENTKKISELTEQLNKITEDISKLETEIQPEIEEFYEVCGLNNLLQREIHLNEELNFYKTKSICPHPKQCQSGNYYRDRNWTCQLCGYRNNQERT